MLLEERVAARPHLAVASPAEKAALSTHTAREEAWYTGRTRFKEHADIESAVLAGKLIRVEENLNTTPIARLRNPDLVKEYPPFLSPGAYAGLRAVGRLWRERLHDYSVHEEELRLAVTSLVRSMAYQKELVKNPEVLANPNSTHCAGGAFDIDAAGYYWVRDGEVRKVSHPLRIQSAAKLIGTAIAGESDTPTQEAPVSYNERVVVALLDVTKELHDQGLINQIIEFEGSSNQCVHSAVNPEVEVEAWDQLAA